MILAGALATGGVPVTAMAADAAPETAGEETGDFGSSEDTDNSAAEEQPTEAPAEPTEAPTEPEQPTTPDTPTKTSDAPKTGDNTNIALFLGLLVLSGAGVAGTYFIKRRKRS